MDTSNGCVYNIESSVLEYGEERKTVFVIASHSYRDLIIIYILLLIIYYMIIHK